MRIGAAGRAAAATGVLALALAGCGSATVHDGPSPTHGPAAKTAASKQTDPLCSGTAPKSGGVHVALGGATRVSAAQAVRFTESKPAGKQRTAVLHQMSAKAATQQPSGIDQGAQRVARVGDTIAGRKVAQICAYRVVLDGPVPSPALTCSPPQGGSAKGVPGKDETWNLVATGGQTAVPALKLSVVAKTHPDKGTASLSALCNGLGAARYFDLVKGDSVDVAGAHFTVASITGSGLGLTRVE